MAEYLKQNPEQGLGGEPEDQGGQRLAGKIRNHKCEIYHQKYQIHIPKIPITPSKIPNIQTQIQNTPSKIPNTKP